MLTLATSKWRWPGIPGLHDFRGTLAHSASWYVLCQPCEGRTNLT
jgi:hypothetical protein